jgi:hypothetical protein
VARHCSIRIFSQRQDSHQHKKTSAISSPSAMIADVPLAPVLRSARSGS